MPLCLKPKIAVVILVLVAAIGSFGCLSHATPGMGVKQQSPTESPSGQAYTTHQSLRRPFKHSDVVAFTEASSLDDYRDFGVTFVAWGGRRSPGIDGAVAYERRIKRALSVGTRIGALLGTGRTEAGRFLEFYSVSQFLDSRCLTVDGQPILVPERKNVRYKGYPAYWLCTNSPAFREYLMNDVKITIPLGPFGIMMDDPLGTAEVARSFGGCYCRHCITGFRIYLKTRFTNQELAARGITDIENFDLRQRHLPYAHLPPEKRSLRKEIMDFQMEQSAQLFKEVMNYARQISKTRLLVSGNMVPTLPQCGALLEYVDYFSCEASMAAATGTLGKDNSLFIFKIADALQRPASIMGYGRDHAFIKERDLSGMLRCWISEAYAFGNYFVPPYYLFSISPEGGGEQFYPQKSAFLPLYRFIKQYAALFDDHEVVARVAVLHSYGAFRKGSQNVQSLVRKLADLNVPFEIVVAGDEVLKAHLASAQIEKYDVLLVPADAILTDEDAGTIRQFQAKGGAVIDEIEKLRDFSTQIRISGASSMRATLRSAPGDSAKPAVVHLLNRDYGVNTDSCRLKEKFTVAIPRKLLGSYKIGDVTYIQPDSLEDKQPGSSSRSQKAHPPAGLNFRILDDVVEVMVPVLDMWGIIVLSPKPS